MNKIPCETCIVLPFCKNKLYKTFDYQLSNPNTQRIIYLCESIIWSTFHCGPMINYLYYDYIIDKEVFNKRITELKETFLIKHLVILPFLIEGGRQFKNE